MKQPHVVIFSPNPYSLYTATVGELLLQRGIGISAIFVRKFTWQRFRSEFSRDGPRLLKKIWTKLILRERAYADETGESIVSFRRAHQISAKNVADLHTRHGIPIHACASLNDPVVEAKLRELQPALIVFTGGGIVRQNILSAAGHGVINCHSGILPKYRGMDVVEWAVLEGGRDKIGCTAHFMDQGLDTGDILRIHHVHPVAGDTIKSLRAKIEAAMPAVLVGAAADFLDGKIPRIPQNLADGQQYFIMHRALHERASAKLQTNDATPS